MIEINDTILNSNNRDKNFFEMNKETIEKTYPITFSVHRGLFIAFFIIGIAFGLLGLIQLFILNRINGFFYFFISFGYILISISYLRSRLWLTKKGLYFKCIGIKGFLPYQNINNVKVSYEKWKIRNFFRDQLGITGRFSYDSVRRCVKIQLIEPQKFYNYVFRTKEKSIILIELPFEEQLAGLIHYGILLNGYDIHHEKISPGIKVNVWPIQTGSYEERKEYLPQSD